MATVDELYERDKERFAECRIHISLLRRARQIRGPGDLGMTQLGLALMIFGWHYNGEWGFMEWTGWAEAWSAAGFLLAPPAGLLPARRVIFARGSDEYMAKKYGSVAE